MSNDIKQDRGLVPNAPLRPDREPPEELDFHEEDAEAVDDDIDDDLQGLDKTLADSFPASDPPQAP